MNFRQSDGTWTQIGITSFAASAGCQSGNPNGFTRIRSLLNWICSTTAGSASCCFPVSKPSTKVPTTAPRPQCPSFIPPGYQCVCTATSCHLVLIPTTPTTTVAVPQCPSFIPPGYKCVCTSISCHLVPIPTSSTTTTTARPPPQCPSFIPPGYQCVCTSISCHLVLIPTTPTTTAPRPQCPSFIPPGYECVCILLRIYCCILYVYYLYCAMCI